MGFSRPIGRPRKVWDEAARIRQLEMENALLKKYHTELRKSLLAKRNIGSSTTTGRIRSESHVCLLWCFASSLLCLGKTA